MRGVIDVFVGQIKRDDLAAVCVKTNMQFAPGAAFRSSMFFEQPFAGSAQYPCCQRSSAGRPFQSSPVREPAIRTPVGSASYDQGRAGRSISNIRMIEPIN